MRTVPEEPNTFMDLFRDVHGLHRQVGDALDKLDDLKEKLRQLAKHSPVFSRIARGAEEYPCTTTSTGTGPAPP